MAPDDASKKSGKELATLSKWSPFGTRLTSSIMTPGYDHNNAEFMSSLGIPVFACTPDKFPDLMAAALNKQDITLWAAKEDMVVKK